MNAMSDFESPDSPDSPHSHSEEMGSMGIRGSLGEEPPRDPTPAQVWLAAVVAVAGCENCMSAAMRHLGQAEGYLGCGGERHSPLTYNPPESSFASGPFPENTTNPPIETEESFPESPEVLSREDSNLRPLTIHLAWHQETHRLYRIVGARALLRRDAMLAMSENPKTGESHYQLIRKVQTPAPASGGSSSVGNPHHHTIGQDSLQGQSPALIPANGEVLATHPICVACPWADWIEKFSSQQPFSQHP